MLINTNKNNYLYLFGTSFLLKIFIETILGPSVFVSLGILFFFFLGFLVLFVSERIFKKNEAVSPPSVQTEPIVEDKTLSELDRLMREYHLELRLRRVDDCWQITFIKHEPGLISIVGMGTATSISDALIKTEADFLEKMG